MSTQLTTTKRAAAGVTAKNTTMISAEAVPEEIEDAAEASSSQPKVALTPAQIRAMVFNAFNSASNQLHAPDEEGMYIGLYHAILSPSLPPTKCFF